MERQAGQCGLRAETCGSVRPEPNRDSERQGNITITMELAQWDKISEEIRLLKASLSAIHHWSGLPLNDIGRKSALQSIYNECEEVLPELKAIKHP